MAMTCISLKFRGTSTYFLRRFINADPRLDFQEKILGPAGPQVFIFVARTSILVAKNYI